MFLDPNIAVLQPCERPDCWCYVHFCSENFLLLPKMKTRQKFHFQLLCWIRYCALEKRGYLSALYLGPPSTLSSQYCSCLVFLIQQFRGQLCSYVSQRALYKHLTGLMWFSVSDLTGRLIELGNGRSWSTRVLPIQPSPVALATLSPKTSFSGWQATLKD